MPTNYLKAVFWDYPSLCDPDNIKISLENAHKNNNNQAVYWIMSRFLERGRVKDTAQFFRLKEIKHGLDHVKISERARKRWERLLEVYGDDD